MANVEKYARVAKRVRRKQFRGKIPGATETEKKRLSPRWRDGFLAKLAETSNVSAACEHVGVSTGTVYDLRRKDNDFARRWTGALYEGYANLEMEVLERLRTGEPAEGGTRFNFAVSIRMLLAHREMVNRERARRGFEDAATARASLNRKLVALREKVLARRAAEAADAARDAGE